MKLVRLTRQAGAGDDDVVVTVGPMEDGAAEDYAARLRILVEQVPGRGLSVDTTAVESVTGETAGPPLLPAELLRVVLSRDGDGDGDRPGPRPRG